MNQPPKSNGEAILIVDDEEDVREMLKEHLVSKGYETLQAADGSIAYSMIEERHKSLGSPQLKLIVCDWMMPNLDGISLLRKLRESIYRSVPFVLMSGAVTREQLSLASKLDPDAILIKPFSLTLLLQKIQQAAEAREGKELARLLRESQGQL